MGGKVQDGCSMGWGGCTEVQQGLGRGVRLQYIQGECVEVA